MATKTRAELRVLVTRPEGRADALLTALRDAGMFCLHQPLLDILPLSDSDPALLACRQRIANLDHYQKLIFISVNAVEYGLDEIDRLWPQWPQAVVAYAIGEATAMALANSSLPVASGMTLAPVDGLSAGSMNSEALLGAPDFQQVAQQKILIFRGVGGREHLAESLRERGAKVDYAECYRRSESGGAPGALLAELHAQEINTVCLNSGETLQSFSAQLDSAGIEASRNWRQTLQLVVPSERVAELAKAAGFNKVYRAENAGTVATLNALQAIGENA